jgi:biopolymer transport protein ExbD
MALKKKKKPRADIPTASTADIGFLLMIFFLCTSTMDTDKGLSLSLPPKGDEIQVHKKNIANLLVNADGQIMLNEEPIQLSAISDRARIMLQQNPILIFSVKTDAHTKYDVYIDVLDQLKRANAQRISIAEPES